MLAVIKTAYFTRKINLVNGLTKETARSLLAYVYCMTFKQIVIFLCSQCDEMFCDQRLINIKTLVSESMQVHNTVSEMLGAKSVLEF
jgi:hypothetical protein